MEIIEQYWEWIRKPKMPLQLIELAGRTCYKSEDKITKDSAVQFVKNIIARGHESVIEHVVASVKFVTDRGVTHELVRHRIASFSQESTRYCNYGSDDIKFIRPVWCEIPLCKITSEIECNRFGLNPYSAEFKWMFSMLNAEADYKNLLQLGWRPEQARSVLPNSLKTEIVMTANVREWRHVFKLRTSKAAHPQIRELMISCLEGFKQEIPVIFDDL